MAAAPRVYKGKVITDTKAKAGRDQVRKRRGHVGQRTVEDRRLIGTRRAHQQEYRGQHRDLRGISDQVL